MISILYKRKDPTKNNPFGIRVWKIETNVINSSYSIMAVTLPTWLLGKNKAKTYMVTNGVNIGKSNEKTPIANMLSIVDTKIKDKKEKENWKSLYDLNLEKIPKSLDDIDGDAYIHKIRYNGNIMPLEEALNITLPTKVTDKEGNILPMLCKQYKRLDGTIKNKLPLSGKTGCVIQPKLNGARVTSRLENVEQGELLFKTNDIIPVLRSRTGMLYNTLSHINKVLAYIFTSIRINNDEYLIGYKNIPDKTLLKKDLVFDGEVYKHGWLLQRISSAIKKKNDDTKKLQYYIYDLAIPNVPQFQRIRLLKEIFENLKSNTIDMVNEHINKSMFIKEYYTNSNINIISLVMSYPIYNLHQANTRYEQHLKCGYEGSVYRPYREIYKFNKRTLTKRKPHMEQEFKIVNVIKSGKLNYNENPIGMYTCITAMGLEFDVTPMLTHKQRMYLLIDKEQYIGKSLTVRFYELTKDKKPMHATGITVRDYE